MERITYSGGSEAEGAISGGVRHATIDSGHRILLWNFDMIPLMQVEGPHVVYWDKFGRPPYDAEFRTSFPASWWYDEERAARIPSSD